MVSDRSDEVRPRGRLQAASAAQSGVFSSGPPAEPPHSPPHSPPRPPSGHAGWSQGFDAIPGGLVEPLVHATPGTTPEACSPDPVMPAAENLLVLNHRREPIDPMVEGLRAAGFGVEVSESLADTATFFRDRPDAFDGVIWGALGPQTDGVELDLLASLQSESRAVPVLLVVDDAAELSGRAVAALNIVDFVVRPVDPVELVARVRIGVARKNRLVAMRERARTLEGQVTSDFKTALLSEQHFRRILDVEFKRARRHGHPLSLMLVDIDDFKSVNDSTDYGFGDDVLRHVARVLKGNVRETDYAARFGGDEFAVLLPHTKPAQAVQTALRMRTRVHADVVKSGGYERSVTVSIGIDTYDGRGESTPQELRRHANKALQESKRRGKNQVWLYARDISDEERSGE